MSLFYSIQSFRLSYLFYCQPQPHENIQIKTIQIPQPTLIQDIKAPSQGRPIPRQPLSNEVD